jgi:peptidoglycan/xylan/chitin deacetylase (PgdA/CDA1 family)
MINRWLIASVDKTGFFSMYSFFRRILTGSQIVIIAYHRITSVESTSPPSISSELFEKQISFLKKNFQLISLDSLSELLRTHERTPKKAAIITFDDGYKDVFINAYPILKKHDVSATIFLTTGYIDAPGMFWWEEVKNCIKNTSTNKISLRSIGELSLTSKLDKIRAERGIIDAMKAMTENEKTATLDELIVVSGVDSNYEIGKDMILSWADIKEMAKNGMTFGAHSVNHPILTKVPIEICRREMIQSKRDIEAILGIPVTSFAYPDGAYNKEIIAAAKESGFSCATTTNSWGLVGKRDNIFALRRIPAIEDFPVFRGLLSGIAGDFRLPYY